MSMPSLLRPEGEKVLFGNDSTDEASEIGFVRTGTAESNLRVGRPNSFYAVLVDPRDSTVVGIERPPTGSDYPLGHTADGLLRIYPVSRDGTERVWRRSYEGCLRELNGGNIICSRNRTLKLRSQGKNKNRPIFSNWTDTKYNAGVHGTNVLKDLMGGSYFSYPKSIYTVMNCLSAPTKYNKQATILDYFAGSGTTAHAVIDLNREDDGSRKYILVEMGEYFDSVLKPRVLKAAYSKDWKNGKPVRRDGIGHLTKVMRLESYEDTLNNLKVRRDDVQGRLIENDLGLREEYLLRYWAELETRSSPSLLSVDLFDDPWSYSLEITDGSAAETRAVRVDLIETFNFLVGICVERRQRLGK